MDYILTQEEYDQLEKNTELAKVVKEQKKALDWVRNQLKQENCYGDVRNEDDYCDTCPLSWLGFETVPDESDFMGRKIVDKKAGKGKVPTYEVSRTICQLSRHYSK